MGLRGFAGVGLSFLLLGAARGSSLRCVLVLALGVISLGLSGDPGDLAQPGLLANDDFCLDFVLSIGLRCAAASRKRGWRMPGTRQSPLVGVPVCDEQTRASCSS